MNKLVKQPSLSRDYFIFAVIVMVGVVLGSLWFSYSLYDSQIRNRNYRFGQEADRIANGLTESFDYIANLAEFIGKQIAEHDPKDLDYIATLFLSKFGPKVKEQDFFLWSIFGWIDLNNKVVVSNREGILKIPNLVSSRNYLEKSPQIPWKLHLDDPNVGITSREYVIPGGMGVTDTDGNYIGTVTMGLNIFHLGDVLERSISTDGISFVLLTRDFRLIAQSSDNTIKPEDGFFQKALGYLQSSAIEKDAGILKKPIIYGNSTFHYYRNVYPYPYIILVGENNYISRKEFTEGVLPFIVPTVIMGFSFLVLLYFFRKKIINPIVALSDAATEIANSRYDVKIPHGNSFESCNLAKALLRIQRSFHKEQQLQQALRQAKEEADAAKEEAIRANQAKTEFLSNMSHELRTPLNATIGFSEVMLSGLFGELSPKNKEYAADIQASGKHLLQLITDLLDINKAESGKFELREEAVNVKGLIDYSLKFIREKAEQKRLRIQTLIPSTIPQLYCDPLRIRQVLVNLLSNAVKYTPDGGAVAIRVQVMKDAFAISVADTGIGIADVEKALSVFGTLDNEHNRSGESTGLGLPLAKKLVELHQAQFVIETRPGEGTKVTMVFPKTRMVQEHLAANI